MKQCGMRCREVFKSVFVIDYLTSNSETTRFCSKNLQTMSANCFRGTFPPGYLPDERRPWASMGTSVPHFLGLSQMKIPHAVTDDAISSSGQKCAQMQTFQPKISKVVGDSIPDPILGNG